MRFTPPLVLVLSALTAGAAAGDLPALEIAGAISRPGKLTIAELQALGSATGTWKEHGRTHQVTGVPIQKVLAARGFSPGPEGKNVPVVEKRGLAEGPRRRGCRWRRGRFLVRRALR